ncbi:hypothetical protein SAMN05444521_5022 [Streptomyces sp. 3214.6]|nr:hypothetical protein SAMN05444521_5022 [Streptomyces sp. 3214.6]
MKLDEFTHLSLNTEIDLTCGLVKTIHSDGACARQDQENIPAMILGDGGQIPTGQRHTLTKVPVRETS